MLGAIVISGSIETERKLGSIPSAKFSSWDSWHSCPASVPLLGCTTVARTVEYLRQSGVEEISVFGGRSHGAIASGLVDVESHAWLSAGKQLRIYREDGLETVLIVRVGSYVECDLAAFAGHHPDGPAVTRAVDQDGSLDFWALNLHTFDAGDDFFSALAVANASEFEIDGYVNRLYSPHDFRRLASDILTGQCKTSPRGVETRPGVWMDEAVQVGRGARIVAPAYIGREARIGDDCLVTRCSNVESWSHIDFGTGIEDSSILTNTYVGIGLDLSQSIVDGDELLNLHHEVRLHISDPVVMRRNLARGHQRERLMQPETSEITL